MRWAPPRWQKWQNSRQKASCDALQGAWSVGPAWADGQDAVCPRSAQTRLICSYTTRRGLLPALKGLMGTSGALAFKAPSASGHSLLRRSTSEADGTDRPAHGGSVNAKGRGYCPSIKNKHETQIKLCMVFQDARRVTRVLEYCSRPRWRIARRIRRLHGREDGRHASDCAASLGARLPPQLVYKQRARRRPATANMLQ
ncbi:hypothetical protein KFL_005310040 [Klebsormidium nitens]|uniref:Uncharacterized protein n=1 Tax=Klebsormidium nitens TaxID=105231 RepID=A0A1Y1IHG5_KLENI|nr:hypothetical protein KFL_005310040 [Klebsormidium nitens]|eukprot:GAQ89512.1 hypothetical protein KFL_005310040 [Klebsormidium nitens]